MVAMVMIVGGGAISAVTTRTDVRCTSRNDRDLAVQINNSCLADIAAGLDDLHQVCGWWYTTACFDVVGEDLYEASRGCCGLTERDLSVTCVLFALRHDCTDHLKHCLLGRGREWRVEESVDITSGRGCQGDLALEGAVFVVVIMHGHVECVFQGLQEGILCFHDLRQIIVTLRHCLTVWAKVRYEVLIKKISRGLCE